MRIDLREARWFGRERAVGYAKMLAIAFGPALIWYYLQAIGPVGSDFTQFWAASKLLLAGDPEGAYLAPRMSEIQYGLGRDHWVPFLCTPPFLAMIAPLSLLPYPAAWAAWVATTYALWLSAARRLIPAGIWPIAVFPGAMVAAWHAQNGLLTAALFIGASLSMEKRPRLAGALLGALVIKPHLALLVPVALLAGRRWSAIAAAAACAAGLLAAACALYGADTFEAWLFASELGPGVLHPSEPEVLLRMPTVYAAVALYTGPIAALAAQAVCTLVMAGLVWRTWARPDVDELGRWAVLALAGVLATPYLFHYDLAALIVPVCWLAREGLRTGFRAWEKLALAIFYWSPFLTRAFAEKIGLNLMPLSTMAFLCCALARMNGAAATSRPPPVTAEHRRP